MLYPSDEGARLHLRSPTALPRASAFLWNKKMMVQANCRGYVTAQFMQPEPAKYAQGPNIEAKTFMQPEQPYYSHHPGRFVYIKDEASGDVFSAPYEPVRRYDRFDFAPGVSDIRWETRYQEINAQWCLTLSETDAVELWELEVTNLSEQPRALSIYPYFTVGYMSWMNQSAEHRPDLGALVATCVTPYQKIPDYFKNQHLKDKTVLWYEHQPDAWELQREHFEGEGGLHNPSALSSQRLACNDARYETPVAALQYRVDLTPGASVRYRFLFGPAYDDEEIRHLKERYLTPSAFDQTLRNYSRYINQGKGNLRIETPEPSLNDFVNHWLGRQLFYHGDTNRLSTDPQTRNYLQDKMGMVYLDPSSARDAFARALSQQKSNGAMPDGVLLHEEAELKYINQVPHSDHCVWLPVCLQAYLDETDDFDWLHSPVTDLSGETVSVYDRVCRAMDWLIQDRDERGLNYIAQGDWCDPMNMVGWKGKGVSGWLSVATAYALNLWAQVSERLEETETANRLRRQAQTINEAVNRHLWDGHWYARGITDEGRVFGTRDDAEGRLFLNPQSWAILAGTCDAEKRQSMIAAIEDQLETPYGVMMLAPSFTSMHEDIGRVTQKHPGTAENGSIYNHAAAFYIYSLYQCGESDRAYRLLWAMMPGPEEEDLMQRGQMPVYIPNYYRGAYHQYPRPAGRSSQLFNTGTVSWVYRILIEELFGLKGTSEGLKINPKLPTHWQEAKITREFRGSHLNVSYRRDAEAQQLSVQVNGEPLSDQSLKHLTRGQAYDIDVSLPLEETLQGKTL